MRWCRKSQEMEVDKNEAIKAVLTSLAAVSVEMHSAAQGELENAL